MKHFLLLIVLTALFINVSVSQEIDALKAKKFERKVNNFFNDVEFEKAVKGSKIETN